MGDWNQTIIFQLHDINIQRQWYYCLQCFDCWCWLGTVSEKSIRLLKTQSQQWPAMTNADKSRKWLLKWLRVSQYDSTCSRRQQSKSPAFMAWTTFIFDFKQALYGIYFHKLPKFLCTNGSNCLILHYFTTKVLKLYGDISGPASLVCSNYFTGSEKKLGHYCNSWQCWASYFKK